MKAKTEDRESEAFAKWLQIKNYRFTHVANEI